MIGRKTFAILLAATLLAVAAAVAIHLGRRPSGDDGGEYLLPQLRAQINDITRVTITGAGNKAVAVLERKDDGWRLASKGDYPADTGQLRRFLLALADARVLERKTAQVDRHAELGVEDVAGKDAQGLRVELSGAQPPVVLASLVIGKAGSRGGTYVRRADEAQAWLVSGNLRPGGMQSRVNPVSSTGQALGGGAIGYAGSGGGDDATVWLDRELLDIAPERIAEVRIERGDDTIRLFKHAQTDEHFVLDDIPKGREPAGVWTLDGPGGLLSALRFDDVLPAKDAAPPEDVAPLRARYTTFDGLVVNVTAWEQDDKHYARLSMDKDSERIAKAQAGDKAATPAAGAPTAPLELDSVDQQIALLAPRLDGWTYVLPSHAFNTLDKEHEDFLQTE